jgi:hypothetical protein
MKLLTLYSLYYILSNSCLQKISQHFSVHYNSLCGWNYCNIFSVYLGVSTKDGQHILHLLDGREESLRT